MLLLFVETVKSHVSDRNVDLFPQCSLNLNNEFNNITNNET